MRLSPKQLIGIADAVANFVSPDDLAAATARCDEILGNIAAPGTTVTRLMEAMRHFNNHERILEFLAAMAQQNPSLREDIDRALLRSLSDKEQLGSRFGVIPPGQTEVTRDASLRSTLERQVQEKIQKIDVALFLRRAQDAVPRLCRIERDDGSAFGSPLGTGFLVGPDLVLTNWHVAQPFSEGQIAPQMVRCRFDYQMDATGQLLPGIHVGLTSGTPVAKSPYAPGDLRHGDREAGADELDYAILRLGRAIGGDLRSDGSKTTRGWFDLDKTPALPAANEPINVLGHPEGAPATLSSGRLLSFAAEGRRLRHDAYTMGGASGSPVFNADFEPVALHHAGDPAAGRAQYNQAIPLALIAGHSRDKRRPAGA